MEECILKKFGPEENTNRRRKCKHGQKKKTLAMELSATEM